MRQGSGLVLATLITEASPMAGLREEQDAAKARERTWTRRDGQGWRERPLRGAEGAH